MIPDTTHHCNGTLRCLPPNGFHKGKPQDIQRWILHNYRQRMDMVLTRRSRELVNRDNDRFVGTSGI